MSDIAVNALSKLVAPANGDNAIVSVALLMEFDTPATEATIVDFSMKGAQFYQWGYLGSGVQKQVINFTNALGGATMDTSKSEQLMAGHSFTPRPKVPRTRLFRDITLRDNQLVLMADQYSRWHRIWSEGEQMLKAVLPVLSPSMKLTSVTLEYVDQFRVRELGQAFPVAGVLNASPWVVGNALKVAGNWHSTHGYFGDASGSGFGQQLNNINVALSPVADVESLTILSQHRYMLPVFDASSSDLLDALKTVFHSAHSANKSLMNEMLTTEAQQLVALNKA